MARQHYINDRSLEIAVGVAALVAGSLLLHDAFEGRGKSRPWATKLLPGA